ncbi:MAG: hypothetical protein N5P05_003333 [Chroococcopsis gigantea SAG 12.99]|jgi:ABC-type methionine transport system ATPase subunit|nr:NIL domain-containing protein [Chlorogloea purpurea SAG 13.99]MDV3001727.1 hypothetical protein [Chroococcopsis gigantea SAG 12.99]
MTQQWQPIDNIPDNLQLDSSQLNRITIRRIKIKIPKEHIQEPIVSELGAKYNIKVNILAALLTAEVAQDGWFDLQIEGRSRSIEEALSYLAELNVEIWHDSAQTASDADDW